MKFLSFMRAGPAGAATIGNGVTAGTQAQWGAEEERPAVDKSPEGAGSLPEALRHRYRIEHRLPNGNHGPSWLVRAADGGGPAVLRYLAAGSAGDALFAANLRHIAGNAARSAHAAHVLEVVEDGSAVWLLREWVTGESLAEALTLLERLTVEQGRALIGAVCRGLLLDDREPFVHGNLRPENVLIEAAGRVLVSDHGLRLVGARLTLAQPLTYQAPELLAGQPPSRQSDVYALGALLYAALCGRYPLALTGDPAVDRRVLAVHEILPPPRGVKLTGGLGHVVWRALQPRAADRYASAAEMLAAIGWHGHLGAVSTAAR